MIDGMDQLLASLSQSSATFAPSLHTSPSMPNVRFQPLPEAGAQRTLEAVGCKALFGQGFGRDSPQGFLPLTPVSVP